LKGNVTNETHVVTVLLVFVFVCMLVM